VWVGSEWCKKGTSETSLSPGRHLGVPSDLKASMLSVTRGGDGEGRGGRVVCVAQTVFLYHGMECSAGHIFTPPLTESTKLQIPILYLLMYNSAPYFHVRINISLSHKLSDGLLPSAYKRCFCQA